MKFILIFALCISGCTVNGGGYTKERVMEAYMLGLEHGKRIGIEKCQGKKP